MAESPAESPVKSPIYPRIKEEEVAVTNSEIPVEIVSDEEMAVIETALATAHSSLAAARSSLSSSLAPSVRWPNRSVFSINARSVHSITLLSKRRLSGCLEGDIDDAGGLGGTQKRSCVSGSFLRRFRRNRALSVTDYTGTEWCEKQMEFTLLLGERRVNKAMRAGQARHTELEEEVVRKVEVRSRSAEDKWALKLINFIIGVNQLLFEGLTRELPLVGLMEGTWTVGVIDEIRMPEGDTEKRSVLVETKTRVRDSLPSESQRRNGKLQLMCYKHLLDTLVTGEFPMTQFFDHFSLNRHSKLSEDIRDSTVNAGFPAETLEDVMTYYINVSKMLLPADNQLIMRYEYQQDRSLVAEVRFEHDADWLRSQILSSLEFWNGERAARYAPEEEKWKCRYCQFAPACPGNPLPEGETGPSSPQKTSPRLSPA